MPCWEKRSVELSFDKMDAELLKAVLESLGYQSSYLRGAKYAVDHFGQVRADLSHTSVVITAEGKVKIVAAYGANLDAAKQAVAQGYARKVIDTTAKKFGWLDRKANAEGTSGRLLRRRF